MRKQCYGDKAVTMGLGGRTRDTRPRVDLLDCERGMETLTRQAVRVGAAGASRNGVGANLSATLPIVVGIGLGLGLGLVVLAWGHTCRQGVIDVQLCECLQLTRRNLRLNAKEWMLPMLR